MIQAILKAWHHRESRLRTWDVSWSGTQFRSIYSSGILDPASIREGGHSFPIRMRLVVGSMEKIRFEYQKHSVSNKVNDVVVESQIELFDGKIETTHCETQQSIFVDDESTAIDVVNSWQQLPLMLFFRPLLTSVTRLQFDSFKVVSQDALLAGQPCSIIGNDQCVLWVGSTQDHLILKCEYYLGGESGKVLEGIVELKYKDDQKNGLVPFSYEATTFHKNQDVSSRWTCQIDECNINLPISPDLFMVQDPRSVWVHDYSANKSYVIRADGTRRTPAPGEYTGSNRAEVIEA